MQIKAKQSKVTYSKAKESKANRNMCHLETIRVVQRVWSKEGPSLKQSSICRAICTQRHDFDEGASGIVL